MARELRKRTTPLSVAKCRDYARRLEAAADKM
jgi:hypothetical protein